MHFRLSQYNLPSYLDGTEEARELNSKLIDEFFKDKKLYKAFVNLADNSKKHYRYISSYDEANFYAYNEYYYAVCIKIGIIRNDSKFIKNQIENLNRVFKYSYYAEAFVFNAVFAVLGYYSIDDQWLSSRDDYIKNLFYNAAVYGLINYGYCDPVIFSKPFDKKIFTRLEFFDGPLILEALCGNRNAALEFIDKEKLGQRKDIKLGVLQNKITLGLFYNFKEQLDKCINSYTKTINGSMDKAFTGRNLGGVCCSIWYLLNGTGAQKEHLLHMNESVSYSEFYVESNLGAGLSGFYTIKALAALESRNNDLCSKYLSYAESQKYYRSSNFFDVMLLVASKIRCGREISLVEKLDLLDVYKRISNFEVLRNICASLIKNCNLFSEEEISGITVNNQNREEPFNLLTLVPDVPEWKYKVKSLIDVFNIPTQNTVETISKDEKKLIWVLSEKGKFVYAYDRKIDASGEVQKGKQQSLYQLIKKKNELGNLSKDDLLLIGELTRIYDICHDRSEYHWNRPDWISAKEVLTDKIISVLYSVKGLYIESGERIIPLKITKSSLKCKLSEKDGKISIELNSDLKKKIGDNLNYERDLLIKESEDELVWYHLGRTELQAASLLQDGITLPKNEFNSIIPLCYGNKPVLSISGEVSSSEVEAKSNIVIQMEHKNDTFYALVGVKPFGRAKSPLYSVGSGPEDPIYNFVQAKDSATDSGAEPLNAESLTTTIKCHRDFKAEKAELDKLLNACPTFADNYEQGYLTIDNLETTLKLLEELEQSDVAYSLEWAKGNKIKVSKPVDASSVHLKISKSKSAGEWFAISGNLNIDADRTLSIQALLNSLSGSRFVEINEGEYISLTEKLRKKLANLKMLASDEKGKNLQLNALVTQAIEQSLEGMDVDADPVWESSVDRMKKAFSASPVIPKRLQAQLRDYQVEGYEWMQRLAIWGVGACLADDMGLGKTVQTIAVLLNQVKEGPCLVLAPTSVGQNWKQEIEKFAPTLNVKRFEARGREALVKSLGKNDVLIVGYGLLNNVEKYLTTLTWSMVVFDEAQALKNFDTKRAKIGKKIPANFRLALTGTPIENRIEDLWSLFNIINPGLLGSWEGFHEKFRNIEPGSSESKTLKTIVKPFLLRRLKSNVLDELPSRTEQNIIVEMNDAEKVFYEDLRSSLVNELEILSSKIERFIEILKNLIEGGHKVLAFSQFTSFLALIEKALKEENIAYQYLDGQTPEKEREKRIENFQNGDGDVFLLSLKAGGTGINLTAADYVVHLDPWWNPAVEDQASDRAHRLGQKRPVTIYRLVSENSVEEKILELHAQKRELAADFLEGTSTSVKKMTEDDLMALLKA